MSKILLVEDNEMNRDMLSRRLIKKGFDVVMAVDGQIGLDMATSESPDLIAQVDQGRPLPRDRRGRHLLLLLVLTERRRRNQCGQHPTAQYRPHALGHIAPHKRMCVTRV